MASVTEQSGTNGDGGLGCDPGSRKAARRENGARGSEAPQGRVKWRVRKGPPLLG